MAKKKFVWEVYLRPNTLTKDNDRDCIADVHAHVSTQRNEDIADIITKERSEFRKETILSILGLRDKAVKDLIQAGNSFMDGLVQISPAKSSRAYRKRFPKAKRPSSCAQNTRAVRHP